MPDHETGRPINPARPLKRRLQGFEWFDPGQVEDTRLFLTENQTGGVRSDGSRVYLQFL